MVYLSMEERRKAKAKSIKKAREKTKALTKTYTIRIYRDTDLHLAIEKASSDAGILPGRYVRKCVIEKLQRDNYLDAEIQDEEPDEE